MYLCIYIVDTLYCLSTLQLFSGNTPDAGGPGPTVQSGGTAGEAAHEEVVEEEEEEEEVTAE